MEEMAATDPSWFRWTENRSFPTFLACVGQLVMEILVIEVFIIYITDELYLQSDNYLPWAKKW